jgi:hypothetical protein
MVAPVHELALSDRFPVSPDPLTFRPRGATLRAEANTSKVDPSENYPAATNRKSPQYSPDRQLCATGNWQAPGFSRLYPAPPSSPEQSATGQRTGRRGKGVDEGKFYGRRKVS